MDLTEGTVRAFLQHGVEHTADKGNDFSRLRAFYRWGVTRQYEDFDPGFLDILRSITAVGNAKGHSVRFRDVLRGPFTPDELLLIARAVREGLGSSQDRAIVMLHMELGHNPVASARMRNSDLVRYETSSAVMWQLDVPRVKKRIPRRETKRRPISATLGSLLRVYSGTDRMIRFSTGSRLLNRKVRSAWRCGALRRQPVSSRRARSSV